MPSKKHDFTVTEIKAGLFVLVSVVLLSVFVSVVSGLRPPEKGKSYHTSFADTGGLNKGADVRFGGIKAGRVTGFNVDADTPSRVRVDFYVREEIPVNAKSKAYITQTTLTAEKHLEISTGEDAAPLLESESEVPSQASGLLAQADLIAGDLREILDDVKKLFEAKESEKTVTVQDILRNVDSAVTEGTDLLKDTRGVIGDSRDDIDKILAKVQEVEDAARDLATHLDSVVQENRSGIKTAVDNAGDVAKRVNDQVQKLAARLDQYVQSIQAILDNAQSFSGDARQFLEVNRPVIEDVLLNLRTTTEHLQDFSRMIAEQPQSVLRGASPQGRQ
ncbi:MAG: MCE family protein [Candidatus Hydrogenedentes bacterium]|nr:MCE family protein [Candidatus Hydrogenedentota bacterium]